MTAIKTVIKSLVDQELTGLSRALHAYREAYQFVSANYSELNKEPNAMQKLYRSIVQSAYKLDDRSFSIDNADNGLYQFIAEHQTMNLYNDVMYEDIKSPASPFITTLDAIKEIPAIGSRHLRGVVPRHGYFVYSPNINEASPLTSDDLLVILSNIISDLKHPLTKNY